MSRHSTPGQHRTPQLEALFEEAKTCKYNELRAYLAAGGQPDATWEVNNQGHITTLPLIFLAALMHHGEHAGLFYAHYFFHLLIHSGRLFDLRAA
jgi:hypothetical protein